MERVSPVKAQMSKDHITGTVNNNVENHIPDEVRKDGVIETAGTCSSSSDALAELSRNDDKVDSEDRINAYQSRVKAVHNCDEKVMDKEQASLNENLDSQSSIKYAVPDVRHGFLTNDLSKASKATTVVSHENDIIKENGELVENFHDLSSDFNGTFMLDEELEIDRKMHKKGVHDSCRR